MTLARTYPPMCDCVEGDYEMDLASAPEPEKLLVTVKAKRR